MDALVAGIDSSTQSCKVVVRQAATGALVRYGQAPHPDGTEVDPAAWWDALQAAIEAAGGLDDVAAVSVGGQQHGMVALDAEGQVIRPALLWNDTRSAQAAADLISELGEGDPAAGRHAWAQAIGSVPVASLTVTKLRWLAEHEPDNAARVAAVALPHDWLTWKLAGTGRLTDLITDRSDASGTGYFDAVSNSYRHDLLSRALGREATDIVLPRVLAPGEAAGHVPGTETVLGPGAGDNAAAALGVGMVPGDVTVSIGTSGVVSAVAADPVHDPSGLVTGFADATGRFLPMATTMNAARVLEAAARMLGVDHAGLAELALAAEPGAEGLVFVPYLEGERTPNLPDATGSLHGMTPASTTPENLARAAVEGMLCGLADGMRAVQEQGVEVRRVRIIGGAARSEAVRQIAPAVLGMPVDVPAPSEFVADGAGRQAAWVLSEQAEAPTWQDGGSRSYEAEHSPQVLQRYLEVAGRVAAEHG